MIPQERFLHLGEVVVVRFYLRKFEPRQQTFRSIRVFAASWVMSACAASLVSPQASRAADFSQPFVNVAPPASPAPPYFLRLGAVGSFFDTGLATTIAGMPLTGGNGTIGAKASVAFESGMFIAPHVAVSLAGGFPPVLSLSGTGTLAPQGVLVKAQSGLVTLTAHYHVDYFGPLKPYAGGGLGYAIVFRDLAAATVAPDLRSNGGLIAQAGLDYDLTHSLGVFLDVKKIWLKQDFSGFSVVPGLPILLPVTARIRSNPILLTMGGSVRF